MGIHLTITESVSPFAVGKYEGPSIEVYFYMANRNREIILSNYYKEMSNFMDEVDILESVNLESNQDFDDQKKKNYEVLSFSNTDNFFED